MPSSVARRLRDLLSLELLDNRFPQLHGMRVIAILSVVQYHVTTIFTYETRLTMDRSWATTSVTIFFGMDLFFILSGFLIGTILLRSIETSGFVNVRRFWLRRAFRTFPAYYVVLTLLALVFGVTALQKSHLWMEYTYLSNYAPVDREDLVMLWGWSLSLEEQFYLSVPFLFLGLSKLRSDRARLTLLGTLWISALVVRLVLYAKHTEWSAGELYDNLYFRTHTRFDTLVCGIMLAYVQQRWGTQIRTWLQAPSARATLALPALGCLWLLMNPWMFGYRILLVIRVLSWGTLTSIMYFLWLLLLLNGGDGWIRRTLSAPFFRSAATLGYGVYLLHIPLCDRAIAPVAHALVKDHGWPMVAVWPLSVAALFTLSHLASYFLHVLVEKPWLRIRDRVAS
ncbi:MAG: acyltransferase family protein [Polyangiaceae bacterium]